MAQIETNVDRQYTYWDDKMDAAKKNENKILAKMKKSTGDTKEYRKLQIQYYENQKQQQHIKAKIHDIEN